MKYKKVYINYTESEIFCLFFCRKLRNVKHDQSEEIYVFLGINCSQLLMFLASVI